MLDAFIIEEIKRREEEEERRRDEGRPRLEIPIEPEGPLAPSGEEKPERGVVIIDYSVDSEDGEEPSPEPAFDVPVGRFPFDRPVNPA
jgi:hypothetical protein